MVCRMRAPRQELVVLHLKCAMISPLRGDGRGYWVHASNSGCWKADKVGTALAKRGVKFDAVRLQSPEGDN